MQQVITISSRFDILNSGTDFKETEYPQLQKYLQDGYTVKEVIPIINPAEEGHRYAVIIVLDKVDSIY